ncbi:CD59B glycoprotein-like [Engraulis encrasicolus]|uniref:CD59B glycoprotein-like n=1 Tax=Engraulis encrasicolus TaxID=184585 RepID=UPI002FD4C17C
MKGLVLSLVLLALFTSGDALKCYVCLAEGGNVCNLYTEECVSNDVCGRFWFTGSPTMLIQGCYKAKDCMELLGNPNVDGKCCDTDLCN